MIGGLLLIGPVLGVLAQDATTTDIGVTEAGGFGPQVVDGLGMTAYVFGQDEEGVSNCTDACTRNWPALVVDGDPVVGEGLDAALVGTLERPDGTLQVTYAGQPLYTYVRDNAPGDANGQGLGGLFFVLSPSGEVLTGVQGEVVADLDEETVALLSEEGAAVYASNCAACHGAEGQGVVGPRLDGNSNLSRGSFLIGRVLNGYPAHGMPPFRDVLDDHQIAALSTYIRSAWSNDFGAVTEEEVAGLR